MEPETQQQAPTPQNPAPQLAAESKRPKVLSISQPEQPKLSKPRILTQIQSTPQPAITTSPQPQLTSSAGPASQTGGADPKSDADWAEQTLTQAERDAEEQRMASDITQSFAAPDKPTTSQLDEKPQDGQNTPKTEPKSVHGFLYAIKGFADSVSRKLAGK